MISTDPHSLRFEASFAVEDKPPATGGLESVSQPMGFVNVELAGQVVRWSFNTFALGDHLVQPLLPEQNRQDATRIAAGISLAALRKVFAGLSDITRLEIPNQPPDDPRIVDVRHNLTTTWLFVNIVQDVARRYPVMLNHAFDDWRHEQRSKTEAAR